MPRGKRIAPRGSGDDQAPKKTKNLKDPKNSAVRTRKPGQKKRNRRRAALTVAAIIVGVLALTVTAVRLWIRPPVITKPPQPSDGVLPGGATIPSDYNRDKDIYTFALLGENEYNTDSMYICSVNTKTQKVSIVGVPRDLRTNADDRNLQKINGEWVTALNRFGNESKEAKKYAYNATKEELSTQVGFPIDNYVGLDVRGFVTLVDMIGGIDFDVPRDMHKGSSSSPAGYGYINLDKGMQHLDGIHALMLVRFRGYTSLPAGWDGEVADPQASMEPTNDTFGRYKVQQMLMKTVAKKAKEEFSITDVKKYLDLGGENLYTDYPIGNLAWFAEQIYKWGGTSCLQFANLQTTEGRGSDKWYEYLKVESALKTINTYLNPLDKPITADMLDVAESPFEDNMHQ